MRAETQLFLHVLGAIVLFGATSAVAVLGVAGRVRSEQLALARAAFWTVLVLAIPAWLVTMAFGEWTNSAENWPDGIGWVDLGRGVIDVGLFALLAAAFLAYRWRRRATGGWHVTALAAIASLYVVALAVAWWAMSAKVPS